MSERLPLAGALRAGRAVVLLLALLAFPFAAAAETVPLPGAHAGGTGFPGGASFPMRAAVTPSPARLGQQLTYRAQVIVADGARASFGRPVQGGSFTWGEPHAERVPLPAMPPGMAGQRADMVRLEVPLQIFTTGIVSVPGPVVSIVPAAGGDQGVVSRLPTVRVRVLPVLTAADSNATLRQVHGPLGAPWWERVPWVLVALALVLIALAVVVVRRLRRKRPVTTPTVPRIAVVPRDPSTEALAALARLRAERLAEQERFGEHALGLTRILRRYLESTLTTPRPGDTSGELVARVRSAGLAADDVERLEGLLGIWDRVKFARAPLSLPEALRCETAVEQLVRRRESPREVA